MDPGSAVARGSYYQKYLTEAGLWGVRQEKGTLSNPCKCIREAWWVAGRMATHVVQVVHCPNLDL